MGEDYERIPDLLDYLVDSDYDDNRDGWMECTEVPSLAAIFFGERRYRVSFERDGKKLQSWVVTVNEDDEIHGGGSSKFKVGDKVATRKWGNGDGSQVADGLIGTVTRVDEATYPYAVILDSGHYELTGDMGPLWCYEHEIEPVDG